MKHLFKLKKDGKTVGYMQLDKVVPNISGTLAWFYRSSLNEDCQWVGNASPWPAFNEALPYVTDDKNGEPVFAGDKCKVPIKDEIMREFEDSDYWELEATVARGFNYWGDVQGHTFTEISDYKTEDIEILRDGEK